MEISKGVAMLEIAANVMGRATMIYPTLLWDNDAAILVDAGYPGQLPEIREAVAKAGVAYDKINIVVVTHHDIDHIGSLNSIVEELSGKVNVLAHEEEKPFIQGDKCPVKLAQLEARLDLLTNEMKIVYEKMKAGFSNCKTRVDRTLVDGEELPYCGGIAVIYTPGHTPGHICLYHKQSKTLIAGDILGVEGGKLVKAPEHANLDPELNRKSLNKLTSYDIEAVISYHGGLYKNNVNQRIKELAVE